MRILPITAVVCSLAGVAHANVFTVNSTLDAHDAAADGVCDDGAGHCTLRAALEEANRDAASDTIQFAIAGAGVHTISPTTVLPTIVQPITIDATAQPGYAGTPLIELAGSWTVTSGLAIDFAGASGPCSVRGLALYDFNNASISIANTACTIAANFIGLSAAGTVSMGSTSNKIGIYVNTTMAKPVIIGGASTADRNVISGNNNSGSAGIYLDNGSGADIIGNYIGTNPAGTAVVDTSQTGIVARGIHVIESNLISGNLTGIQTFGTSGLTIKNNLIGTDISGTTALANNVGIDIGTSGNTIVGNTISGNGTGVSLYSMSTLSLNVLAGNFIGTTPSGTGAIGNGQGISLRGSAINNTIGGNLATARNIISGNNVGVSVFLQTSGSDSLIGNYIGLDINGDADGNSIGVNVTGSTRGFTVGAVDPVTRNIISGNTTAGVWFNTNQSPGNSLVGNYVGTSADGLSARPNGVGVGVDTATYVNIGDASGGGNLISGNTGAGIALSGVSFSGATHLCTVAGNRIGVDANGGPLPNQVGLLVGAFTYVRDNVIGGAAGAGNIIRSNAQGGVVLKSGVNNRIQANAIDANGGLGIDLGGDGVTANDVGDVDSGPNQLQNFPVLTRATSDGTNSWFAGTLASSQSATYVLELFTSPSCDASGNGQGATYIGTVTTTTDASGNASFSAVLPGATGGLVSTATAYNASSGTSEFSACQPIKACPVIALAPSMLPDGQAGVAYSQLLGASGGSTPYAFAVTNGTLPTGLTLASDGTLSGTPTASSAFAFTVTATDGVTCAGMQQFTLMIAPAAGDLGVGPDLATLGDDLGPADDLGGVDDFATAAPPDLAHGGDSAGGCGCSLAARRSDGSTYWAASAILLVLTFRRRRAHRVP
jgi:trimeric autotransporter adhesin